MQALEGSSLAKVVNRSSIETSEEIKKEIWLKGFDLKKTGICTG